MSILTDWYHANQLSLNINKTILIKFWPDSKPFTVKIGDVKLNNSNSTKFLGLVAWDSMIHKSLYNSLYKLQKECVKLVAKVLKSSSVEPIFDRLNLIRLSDLIENELKKTWIQDHT